MAGQKFRKFSAVEDQKLVASVMKYPILYNHEGFTRRNVQLMREGWQAVSTELGISEKSCKRRWRDIRDHYFKIKRKEEITKIPVSTKWPIYDKLSFLEQGVRLYKRRARVLHGDPMDQEDDYPSMENTFDMYEPETTFKIEASNPSDDTYSQLEYVMAPPHMEADTSCRPSESSRDVTEDDSPVRGDWRRPAPEVAGSRAAEEEDDVDVFMKSIALSVRRFPPILRADAKMKILSLVTDLEFPSD